MPCPLCDTLARVRAAAEPAHIADLAVSTLILSEDQGCPGWCVLVLTDHHEHLESLPPPLRARFLEDLSAAAGAIRAAFPDVQRLNYACLGNLVPHLHWHLIPRRPGDPPGAVWSWPGPAQRGNAALPTRSALIHAIRSALPRPTAPR